MARLGAYTASALDSGGSTTMAFDGKLLNRPSDRRGERAVAETLGVLYMGIYLPPLRFPAMSLMRDGVADRQQLSYKVVAPSTVTARLVDRGRTVVSDVQARAGDLQLPVAQALPAAHTEKAARPLALGRLVSRPR